MSKTGGGRSGGKTGKTTDLSAHQSYTQPKSPQYQLNNSRDMSRSTTQQLNSTVEGATGSSSSSNSNNTSEEEWKWGRRRPDWGRYRGWDRKNIFAEEEETTPMYVATGATVGTTGSSASASAVPVPANSLVSTTNPITSSAVVSNMSASQLASTQQTQEEISALTMFLSFSSLICCFFLVAMALVAILLYLRL